MKIAITGHTRNIGAGIADEFFAHGHEILGFSRSTGYDLSDPTILNNIIPIIETADVFINNAYVHDSQTLLLKEMIKLWKNTNKTIIHIGSIAALAPLEYYMHYFGSSDTNKIYYQNKKEQLEIINNTLMFSTQRLSHVLPGLTFTDHIPNRSFPIQPLKVDSIAKVVYNLTIADSSSFIQQVTISNLNT
jgi:NADP-dependent 3-hydroxy acid dehydrogenase YdfG